LNHNGSGEADSKKTRRKSPRFQIYFAKTQGLVGLSSSAMIMMPAITAAAAKIAIRMPFSPSSFSEDDDVALTLSTAGAALFADWAATGAATKETAATAAANLPNFIKMLQFPNITKGENSKAELPCALLHVERFRLEETPFALISELTK
jgi:hypothetical protein